MEKIESLIKLNELLNSGSISQEEYQKLKEDLIRSVSPIQKDELNTTAESFVKHSGSLTIYFSGIWLLFDAKTKIFIDGKLHSIQSTKKGFEIKIPLKLPDLKIELIFMGMKTTRIELSELNTAKNYIIELEYDSNWGKYSDKINLLENA